MQEVLASVREEVLATTKLPMAIDFLLAELRHAGVLGSAMARLEHYFTPFQVFVIQESEDERRRFDLRIGLEVLRREAEYRAESPTRQGLFLYQFEALCRNRLGYDRGLEAVARDPAFDDDLARLDPHRAAADRHGRSGGPDLRAQRVLSSAMRASEPGRPRPRAETLRENELQMMTGSSGPRTPRLALRATQLRSSSSASARAASRWPIAARIRSILFASLHRQLGYPEVPRPQIADTEQALLPQLARRMEQLETRLKLVEEEQRGGIDLTKFYERPDRRHSPSGSIRHEEGRFSAFGRKVAENSTRIAVQPAARVW